jgi:hypothetical protein
MGFAVTAAPRRVPLANQGTVASAAAPGRVRKRLYAAAPTARVNSESRPRTDPTDDRTAAGYGRRVLLTVGVGVVLTTGLIGFVVGSNNAGRVAAVDLFGLVTVPTTGVAWATVGIAVAAAGLSILFGLVEVASRLEAAEDR